MSKRGSGTQDMHPAAQIEVFDQVLVARRQPGVVECEARLHEQSQAGIAYSCYFCIEAAALKDTRRDANLRRQQTSQLGCAALAGTKN